MLETHLSRVYPLATECVVVGTHLVVWERLMRLRKMWLSGVC